MKEVELKFQVPEDRRRAVHAFVTGRRAERADSIHLQAAYFDTPDRRLAEAGVALRLRREGRQWVQTLKGAGNDGLSRAEHNVPLQANEVDAASLCADPQRHAGVPVGDRLLKLLRSEPTAALACSYRTDIQRLTRTLRSRHGTVELALDEGELQAGERRLAVCELEIELLSGHPLAVLAVARRWAPRLGLWLDTRSKAERGDMLSRDVAVAAPCHASDLRLQRDQSACQGLQAVIASCRPQVLVNAAQIATGEFDPEHVHQLRVGLRRLRSALRLFDGNAGAAALAAPLAEPAAQLFRRLGAARDGAVMDGELANALHAALRAVVADAALPGAPPDADGESPAAVLREAASQNLLLDLIAVGLPPAPVALGRAAPTAVAQASTPGSRASRQTRESRAGDPTEPGLRVQLSRRLGRWHRDVLRDAANFAQLDDAARHRLRKHIKRLRYSAEFAAGLFDSAQVRRSLKPLRRVQERLGALNDVAVAIQAFDVLKADDPRAWFALGWLAARREALLGGAGPELKALAKGKRFWKKP